MDLLKKIWAFSFAVKKKDVTSVVVNIILWVVGIVIASVVLGLAGWIGSLLPGVLEGLVGWALRAIGSLVDLYCVAGIVLSVLNFCDVLKD